MSHSQNTYQVLLLHLIQKQFTKVYLPWLYQLGFTGGDSQRSPHPRRGVRSTQLSIRSQGRLYDARCSAADVSATGCEIRHSRSGAQRRCRVRHLAFSHKFINLIMTVELRLVSISIQNQTVVGVKHLFFYFFWYTGT